MQPNSKYQVMTPIALFQKYLWMLNAFLFNGPMTIEEINDRWSKAGVNYMKESRIPRRTFFRMKNAIESVFDVEIRYSTISHKYYIDSDEIDDSLSKWMLETMSINNFILTGKEIKDKILIEDYPSATEDLSLIIKSIKSGKTLSLSMDNYQDDKLRKYEVEPLCVKTFKRRWYLLGRSCKDKTIDIYPLDRISDLTMTGNGFTTTKSFDALGYFKNYYGVLTNENPETVLLKVTPLRAKYLRSLPLHHSQKEVETKENSSYVMKDGYSIFELYVAPTFDFIQELRSLGPEIKVLSPSYLADIMRRDALRVADLYENNF